MITITWTKGKTKNLTLGMRFAEIPGQQGVKDLLKEGFASGKVPHALLLTGPEGCGKLPLGLAYASLLLCQEPLEHDACGVCPACLKVGKLVHPDLHFVFPVINQGGDTDKNTTDYWIQDFRKAFLDQPHLELEDWRLAMNADHRQANISRAECYSILSKLGLAAFEGRYKVVILWLAEFLGDAGNLLLKILEEPPDQTVFILVSAEPEQILTTIRSRVRSVRIGPMDSESIRLALLGMEVQEQRAAMAALASEGNLRKAMSMIYEEPFEHSVRWTGLMRLAYSGQPSEAIKWVNQNSELGRESLKSLFDYGLHILRECYLYREIGRDPRSLREDEKEFVHKFSPFVSAISLSAMQSALEKAAYRMERNGHIRLVLHNLYFDLQDALVGERRRMAKASAPRVRLTPLEAMMWRFPKP
jgi:DNA polymerase-3 subunit delta'